MYDISRINKTWVTLKSRFGTKPMVSAIALCEPLYHNTLPQYIWRFVQWACAFAPILENQIWRIIISQWLLGMLTLRAGSHHGPWSMTMEDGICPRSDLMIQLPWFDFLPNQFTKPLGPSLGVNRMCTKRNDHAPKRKSVDFFNICPKGAVLKKTIQVWSFSCLLLSSSSLPPPKIH